MKQTRWIMWLMLILFSSAIDESAANALPFCPGERLTYELKWAFLPVGEAVLEVGKMDVINGEPAFHFILTARSYPFLDMIFKVRDRIDSFTDVGITQSLHYRKNQHEGKTRRNIVVNFDWDRLQARYSMSGQTKKHIQIAPGSFDPLSVFFYSRTLKYRENQEIVRPVTDGKRAILGRARVVRREKLKVNGLTYDTYLLEPDLEHVSGVFEKSKNASIQLWVTADHRKIPVRIKSRVIVGNFSGDLIADETICR